MGAITAEVIDTGDRRDVRGRRRFPAAQRAEYVRLYRQSGMTQAAFAKREGLGYSTFTHWVQKAARKEAAVTARGDVVEFAQVPWPATGSISLEVRLPDGTVLRGERAEELAKLVRALRGA